MPRQNRVTPFGELIATPARGTLTGNRGCLHDEHGRIRRNYQGQRWIICLLEFKGRKRPIMTPGRYTELFFLDEATALAAGHRPCAECQRQRFNLFRSLWAAANPDLARSAHPSVDTLDAALHRHRLAPRAAKSITRAAGAALPDGAFVADEQGGAYLVWSQRLRLWTPYGYEAVDPAKIPQTGLSILTPASILRTLAEGYPVEVHLSAMNNFY